MERRDLRRAIFQDLNTAELELSSLETAQERYKQLYMPTEDLATRLERLQWEHLTKALRAIVNALDSI